MAKRYWREAAHRLRVTRLVLGITEQEAADAFGVSLATYLRYEAGAKQRSASTALRFAKKYDVNLDWLFGGEPGAIKPHLAKRAPGNVAILPALSRRERINAVIDQARADSAWIAERYRALSPEGKARITRLIEEREKLGQDLRNVSAALRSIEQPRPA